MYIPFEKIEDTARVWVYQSDRPLTIDETTHIMTSGKVFAERWEAHGSPLKASITVLYHQFLVIAVDSQYHPPSGCSIDSSVAFVKQLAQLYKVDFFNRTNIAFLDENKVVTYSISQIKQKASEGILNKKSITFNNLVNSKEDLDNSWKIQVGESWLEKYLI